MADSKLAIRTNDFKKTIATGQLITCSQTEKIRAAAKKTAFFWLLALACIFIPVMHFILVPAMLLIGVAAFFRQMKSTHHFSGGSFTCPKCQQNNSLKSFYLKDQQRSYCKSCSEQLVFEI